MAYLFSTMAENIPKWVMQRYAKLWKKFKDKPFNFEDELSVLQEKETISVVLSELRKAKWLDVKLDPHDTRKRIYVLKSPEKAIKEVIKEF